MHQPLPQPIRVCQIAVVANREPAELEIGEQRLDIAHRHFAGRRIPHMPDCRMTAQTLDNFLRAEIVADLPCPAVGIELLAIIGDDPRRFLAAML